VGHYFALKLPSGGSIFRAYFQPPTPACALLVPERSDFLEGDTPAAAKVEALLARALEATGSDAPSTAGALVP
jgi:hypothetical protein